MLENIFKKANDKDKKEGKDKKGVCGVDNCVNDACFLV